jgi:CAAX prenyl protease-like protein
MLDEAGGCGYGLGVMSAEKEETSGQTATPLPPGLLSTYPWLTFVLPFALFILFGSLEPKPPDPAATADVAGGWFHLNIDYRHYPLIYTIKLAVTLAAMGLVLPGYRTFPWRVSWYAPVVGVVGGVVWIVLSQLQLEAKLFNAIGLGGLLNLEQRSAFDPLTQLQGGWAYGFLTIRLVGLALVVPVIEEFFLRGFLMRYVMDARWWTLPFGVASRLALVMGTAVPVLYHPEMLAALVWFSAVSYLMIKTRSIWDCVVAHGLTNLVLGIYVITSDQWHLL